MMEENLFVYVECSSVKHVASRFSVRKNVTKKKERKKVTPATETGATCPNKQFRNKSLFSLPICQEEINKVIFV